MYRYWRISIKYCGIHGKLILSRQSSNRVNWKGNRTAVQSNMPGEQQDKDNVTDIVETRKACGRRVITFDEHNRVQCEIILLSSIFFDKIYRIIITYIHAYTIWVIMYIYIYGKYGCINKAYIFLDNTFKLSLTLYNICTGTLIAIDVRTYV